MLVESSIVFLQFLILLLVFIFNISQCTREGLNFVGGLSLLVFKSTESDEGIFGGALAGVALVEFTEVY